jgi:hypothetical protein
MKVRALRGVCIGVGRHLAAGDTVDLEPALVTFLVGIGAAEVVKDEPPAPVVVEPEPEFKSKPVKPGKEK